MTVHRFSTNTPAHPCELEIECFGAGGEAVLLIPSLGRGREDFRALAQALASADLFAVALDPRGIGHSAGASFADLDLHDLANDAAAALTHLGIDAAHVVGHAFGNRIARCLRAGHPQCVKSLSLLAAGGRVPPDEEARAAFRRLVNEPLAGEAFLELVAKANFSPQSDPSPWGEGWWLQTALAQAHAAGRTQLQDWWDPGEIDVLIVQGLDDRMAPPGNGRQLAQLLGERAQLIEVAAAGHALLPEKPEEVARAVVSFLSARRAAG